MKTHLIYHHRTVSDKEDDELFAVDVKPDEALLKLTPKQLRKLKAQQTPKSLSSLENQSQVKDPIGKRNRVKTKEERKHPLLKRKDELKAAEGFVPERLKRAQTQRLAARQAKKEQITKKKVPKFTTDLWADEESAVPKELDNEWYNKNLVEHNLKGLGKPKVRPPGELRATRTKLKAIQAPHPGLSYNPTFDDHQELVEQVVAKEETINKKKERLERVTKAFGRMTRDQIAKMKEKEAIQGLPIDTSKENMQDEEPSDDDYKSVNAPVRNKKKDRKARRKQKEAREREILEKQKKRELKKVKDINNVPELTKKIKHQEKVVEIKGQHRAELEKAKKTQAGRLAKVKYREPEIDVSQLEDIAGNLRNLKPEGNLLLDRFKSLQKRNILPSTLHRKRKMKTMVKKYIKQSHKNEGLKTKNYIKPPKSSR